VYWQARCVDATIIESAGFGRVTMARRYQLGEKDAKATTGHKMKQLEYNRCNRWSKKVGVEIECGEALISCRTHGSNYDLLARVQTAGNEAYIAMFHALLYVTNGSLRREGLLLDDHSSPHSLFGIFLSYKKLLTKKIIRNIKE
jgi:hypothetical protein